MKKVVYFLALTGMLVLASCGKKNPLVKVDIQKPDASQFSKGDTAEIMSLCNQFMDYMSKKDVRGAVDMLNLLNGDSIEPLNKLSQDRQAAALKNVLGVGYTFDGLILRSHKDNELKIGVTLFEKQEGENIPNTTALYFRPVKFEGRWYLTARDKVADINSGEGDENL